MIKCKDIDGKILDNSYRTEQTNALVFSPNDKYKYYIKEKENMQKMKQLEDKITELTALVTKLIKSY